MPAASPESETRQGPGDEPGLNIAGLRERGADRFDPPRFRYLEALCRRAAAHDGAARQVLEIRLNNAVAAYQSRFESAGEHAELAVADSQASSRSRGPLGELVDYIDSLADTQDAGPAIDAAVSPSSGAALAELKTLRQFRKTWTRLSVDQQLSQSQQKIPDNPGPLNSYLLVQRSLKLMQEISPAYLKHFMSHVESLLWLDQASFGGLPAQGKTVLRQTDKKRKAGGRGKSGQERR